MRLLVAVLLVVLVTAPVGATPSPEHNIAHLEDWADQCVELVDYTVACDPFTGGGPGHWHRERITLTSGAEQYTQSDNQGLWEYQASVDLTACPVFQGFSADSTLSVLHHVATITANATDGALPRYVYPYFFEASYDNLNHPTLDVCVGGDNAGVLCAEASECPGGSCLAVAVSSDVLVVRFNNATSAFTRTADFPTAIHVLPASSACCGDPPIGVLVDDQPSGEDDNLNERGIAFRAAGADDVSQFVGAIQIGSSAIGVENTYAVTVGTEGLGAGNNALMPIGLRFSNASGGTVAANRVVTLATGASSSFTTTTTANDPTVLGVTLASIGNAAEGPVAVWGITTVDCTAAAIAVGDYLVSSTSAGLCQSGGTVPVSGAFGRATTDKAVGVGSVRVLLHNAAQRPTTTPTPFVTPTPTISPTPLMQTNIDTCAELAAILTDDPCGLSTTIVLKEVDGAPNMTAGTIETLQTDGLRVTDTGSGVGRVSIDSASTTQKGAVDTAQQAFAGFKIFANGGQAGPSPSLTPTPTSTAATPTPTSVTPTPTATATAVWTDYGTHDIKGGFLRLWSGSVFSFLLQFANTLILRPPTGGIIELQDPLGTSVTRIRGDHVISVGAAPGLSACGVVGSSIASYSTDSAGRITVGSPAPTSCIITFATGWTTNPPACWCNDETGTIAVRAVAALSTLTCNGPFVVANVLTYGCTGME